jgi:hypothetical protein
MLVSLSFLHSLRSPSEGYLTPGSLHRTCQDKGSHMLPVITVKQPFITQFHPHHLHHCQVLS